MLRFFVFPSFSLSLTHILLRSFSISLSLLQNQLNHQKIVDCVCVCVYAKVFEMRKREPEIFYSNSFSLCTSSCARRLLIPTPLKIKTFDIFMILIISSFVENCLGSRKKSKKNSAKELFPSRRVII